MSVVMVLLVLVLLVLLVVVGRVVVIVVLPVAQRQPGYARPPDASRSRFDATADPPSVYARPCYPCSCGHRG